MSNEASMVSRRAGWWHGVAAFGLWGLLPVFWKQIDWLGADQVVVLRAVSCVPLLLLVLAWRGRLGVVGAALRRPRVVGLHVITAALLGGNWLAYVWATQNGQIVTGSLGYFLTPLANVGLGALVLGERLRVTQWVAVGLAAVGGGMQVLAVGGLPWVALVLCGTFALYGLLRKMAPLDSLEGLAVESLLALPFALVWLWQHPPAVLAGDVRQGLLLAALAPVTTIPLLAFAKAARLLPLAMVGLLQFLAPSLQFLMGSLVYGEPVSVLRLASFAVIWLGLVVMVRDLWRSGR
ncbi:MAG: EamA family transporter RarD [Verrucomicrobiota bacterium]